MIIATVGNAIAVGRGAVRRGGGSCRRAGSVGGASSRAGWLARHSDAVGGDLLDLIGHAVETGVAEVSHHVVHHAR